MSNLQKLYAGSQPVVGPGSLARTSSGNDAATQKENVGSGFPRGGSFKKEEKEKFVTDIKRFGVVTRKAGRTYKPTQGKFPCAAKLAHSTALARPYCSLIKENPKTAAAARKLTVTIPLDEDHLENGCQLVCTCPTTYCQNIASDMSQPCWGSSAILNLLRRPRQPDLLVPSQVVWDMNRKEVRLNAKIMAIIRPEPKKPRFKFLEIEVSATKRRDVSQKPLPVGKPHVPSIGFPYVDLRVTSIERRPRTHSRGGLKRKVLRVKRLSAPRPPVLTQSAVDVALLDYQANSNFSGHTLKVLSEWINGAIVIPNRPVIEAESLSHLSYIVHHHRNHVSITFSRDELITRPSTRYDRGFYLESNPLLTRSTFYWWRQVRDPRAALLRLRLDDDVGEALDWLHTYQRNVEWWDLLFYANTVSREVLTDCHNWLEVRPTASPDRFQYIIKDHPGNHGYASDLSPNGWTYLRAHANAAWNIDFDPYETWRSLSTSPLPTTYASPDFSILGIEWIINYYHNKDYWDSLLVPTSEAESITMVKPCSHPLLSGAASAPPPWRYLWTILSLTWIVIWGGKQEFEPRRTNFVAYLITMLVVVAQCEYNLIHNLPCERSENGCVEISRSVYAATLSNPGFMAAVYMAVSGYLYVFEQFILPLFRRPKCSCGSCVMRRLPRIEAILLKINYERDGVDPGKNCALLGPGRRLADGLWTGLRLMFTVVGYNLLFNKVVFFRTLAGSPIPVSQVTFPFVLALSLFVPLLLYFDPPSVTNFRAWLRRVRKKLELLLTVEEPLMPLPNPQPSKLDEAIKFAEREARKAAVAYATAVDCEAETGEILYAGAHAVIATMPDWVLADIGPQHVYGFQAIIDFCVTISCGPKLPAEPTYLDLMHYYAHHYAALNLVVLAISKHSLLRYVLTELGHLSLTKDERGSWNLDSVPSNISFPTPPREADVPSVQSSRGVTIQSLLSRRDGASAQSTQYKTVVTEFLPSSSDESREDSMREAYEILERSEESWPFVDESVEGETEDVTKLMGQYPQWLSDIEKFTSGTLELGKSKTLTHLEAILAALAAAPWIGSLEGKVDITKPEERDTFVGVLRSGLTCVKDTCNATRGLIDASLYFAKFGHNLYVTGGKLSDVYSFMESEGSSSIWLAAFDNHQLLMSGAYKQTEKTLPAIWDSFLVCEAMLRNSLRHSTGLAKVQLEKQAQMVLAFKQDWKAVANMFAVKMEPFTMTLYGAPGIGKTASVKYFLRYLHAIIEEPHPKISFVTEADAFDGGFDNATTAIVWDDIGNLTAEAREHTISERMVRYVNSYRTQFTGAGVEEKNVKFNFAKLCLFTTNSENLGIKAECTNPASIWRRLGMKVECMVKQEYSDGKNGFDRDKLPENSKGLDNYLPEQLEYQEYVLSDKGSKIYVGPRMNDVLMLETVRDRCKKHFNFQKKSMDMATDEPINLCEHCMPKHVCRQCTPLPVAAAEDGDHTPMNFWKSVAMRLIDNVYGHILTALNISDYDWLLGFRDSISVFTYVKFLLKCFVITVTCSLYAHMVGWYPYLRHFTDWDECAKKSFLNKKLPHLLCKNASRVSKYVVAYHRNTLQLNVPILALFPLLIVATFAAFYAWDCALLPLRILKKFSTTPVPSLMAGYVEARAVFHPSRRVRYTQWLLGSGALAAGLYGLFAPRKLAVDVHHSGSLYSLQKIDMLLRSNEMDSFQKYKLSRELDEAVEKANSVLGELLRKSLYVPAKVADGEEGEGNTEQFSPVLTLDKRKELVTEARQNWVQAVRVGSTGPMVGMTLPQAQEKLLSCCMSFNYMKSEALCRSVVIALESRFLLIPDHAFKVEVGENNDVYRYVPEISGTVKRRFGSQVRQFPITLSLAASKKLEGTDIRMCICNLADAFPNCVDLLPTKMAPTGAEVICSFTVVCPDTLTGTHTPVEALRCLSVSRQAGSFESWRYSLPFDTYAGLCMSFLLRKTRSTVIEGFHVAGGKTDRMGRAAIVTRKLYIDAREFLETTRCEANRATGLSKVVTFNPVTKVSKAPHVELETHSIGKFVPEELLVKYIEEFDKTSRKERHTFEPNAACGSARAHFKFPITTHLPKLQMRVLTRNTMIIGCSDKFPPMDTELLNEAFADYVSVVPLAVSRMLSKKWARTRPLTYDEVLNGIPGHPYASTIKVNTSAGWPFGVKKKQVLLKSNDEQWYMPDDMFKDLLRTEIQVCVLGYHSGLPYTGTAKSEARDRSKLTARLFFGSPLFTYIMLHRFLVLPLSVINLSPELFETSLGRDRLSPNWHLHLLELLEGDPLRCNATDFSTYDQSQNPDVRIAATQVFVHICRHLGYSKADLGCVRMLVNEFLMPYLSLGGFVVLGTTIQPSGNNLTAHTNGIATSLLMRASFIRHHALAGRPFRDYVVMRTLGDDNIMSFTEHVDLDKWNGVVFAEDCKEWGLLVTPSDKSVKITPTSNLYEEAYLRSKPYYNLCLGRVVSVLDPHSIFKPLQFHERSTSVTPEEQLRDTMSAILNECFFYGEKCYEWARENCLRVGEECGLPSGCTSFNADYKTVLAEKKLDDLINYEKSEPWPIPDKCPTTPPYFAFWEGEWPEHVEAETEDGLVEFEMEKVVGGQVETKTMDLSPISEAEAPFAKFFERSVAVASFSIPYDRAFHHTFDPYSALFDEPEFINKMNTWAVGKSDVELTFVGSSTIAHSGLMQISYVPIPNSNIVQDETMIDNDLLISMRSQRKCVYWDISTSGGAKIDVPFLWPYAAVWLRRKNFSGLNKVYVNVIAPMLHVSNNESPIHVTVYAKFKNFSFSGSTAVSVTSETESFSSVVSSLADAASLTSKYLSFAPQLAMVSDYASMTLEGIAGVARYFGHSRPIVTANFVSMYTSPPLATCNDNLNGRTLGTDRDQGVSMSSAVVGIVETDPLVFESFYRPNILGVFQWTSTDSPGHKLFHLVNSCCHGIYSTGAWHVLPTTSAMVTANFASAHWVNRYKITVITPSNNAGMLQLVSEPTGIPLGRSTLTNRSLIMDIQTSKTIDVTCEWQQPVTLRTTHNGVFINPIGAYDSRCMNGAIALYVETPLAAFSDTTQNAYIVVEGWIERVRLGNYAPMDITSYSLARPLKKITTARTLTTGPHGLQRVVQLQPGKHSLGSHSVNTLKRVHHLIPTPTTVPTHLPLSTAVPTTKPAATITPIAPSSAPTKGPSALPTPGSTDAPTPIPVACEAELGAVPLAAVTGGLSGIAFPYLNATEDELTVPSTCTTLVVPVFSNGVTTSQVQITFLEASGLTVTTTGGSHTITSDSAMTHIFTQSFSAVGMWTMSLSLSGSGGDFKVTALNATLPSLYSWHRVDPTPRTFARTNGGGTSLLTYKADNDNTWDVPVVASPFCGGSRGDQAYLIVYAEGVLRKVNTSSSLLLATIPDVGTALVSYSVSSGVRISSGFDSPILYVRSAWYLALSSGEVEFGTPYRGLEYIAPVHFGEQIFSFRTLWKVFKTTNLYYLSFDTIPTEAVKRTDGAIAYSAVERIYNIGEYHNDVYNLLTLDRYLFWCFGCVRGSMVGHYTIEKGDGLVKFRRGVDDTTTDVSARFRGFEQMHSSVQRAIVINWPYYADERFLIPRDLSATEGAHPRMIKEIELQINGDSGEVLSVREDSAIGEDFSVAYFLGGMVLEYQILKGSSDAPPLDGATVSPATQAPTPKFTNAPSLDVPADTHAPSSANSTLEDDDNLFNGRKLQERKSFFSSSLFH